MKRHVSGALMAGALVLAVLSCTEDPLASLRGGGPKRILLSASTLTVNVNDSVAVTATVVDDQGNPLTDAATATSNVPATVSVSAASGAPLPVSKFFVKGVAFGNTFVKFAAGAASDSIRVFAYGASVTITGTPDSLNSGSTVVLTATPRDAVAAALLGVSPITWTSDDNVVASATTPGAAATVTGKTPGVATLTVTLPGGANAATPLRVVPAPFNGTLSASTGGTLDVITIDRGAGSGAFDADVSVTFGGEPALLSSDGTADQIKVAVPIVSSTGLKELSITNIGANQLAQRTTFTVNATTVDDSYEATNNDPFTAPVIAADGDYYVIVHGDCHPDNVQTDPGLPHDPGDDCDDFFTITNASLADVDLSLSLTWMAPGSDIDMAILNAAADDYVNTDGITGDDPEVAEFTLAAGETVRVWINLYTPDVADNMARLTVTGMP